ncbi:MAG: M12 family metallopeptidase [Bacteroidia bacterium]|nr:M12 family metallopeptidase [Bacteroidia bacterium]
MKTVQLIWLALMLAGASPLWGQRPGAPQQQPRPQTAQTQTDPGPPKTAYLRLPFRTRISKLSYVESNGLAILEGDIILGTAAEVAAKSRANEAAYKAQEAGGAQPLIVIDDQDLLWKNNLLPYTIKAGDFSKSFIDTIVKAVNHLSSSTNLTVSPRVAEADYVEFVKTGDNSVGGTSAVGRQGGKQLIYLNPASASMGTVVHEMMHALGFFHEHTRADRNSYVTIQWQNIMPDKKYAFEKHGKDGYTYFSYNKQSLMHYGGTAFSLNGLPTIIDNSTGNAVVSQRSALSPGDITGINAIYPASPATGTRPESAGTLPSAKLDRIMTTKVTALDTKNGPNEMGPCNSDMDYYAEIKQGSGDIEQYGFNSSVSKTFAEQEGNRLKISWSSTVPLTKGVQYARITIKVYDKDDALCGGGDDIVDVSAAGSDITNPSGDGFLRLWVDCLTGEVWELKPTDATNDSGYTPFKLLGKVGETLKTSGSDSDHAAYITFMVTLAEA